LLRQIEVAVANGKTTTPVACRENGITEQRTIAGGKSTVACRRTRRGGSKIWRGRTLTRLRNHLLLIWHQGRLS